MPNSVLENTATVANLLAAYEGESNAHAKYVGFAAKADAEGWHGAASLFRAAARAEEIHAKNHARVLKQLGAEAQCEIHAAEVKSTLENLKAALAGELYEIETMYPASIAEATESDLPIAKRSFAWAMEAEKTHAQLYAEAIELVAKSVKESWAGSACDFYVCAACGYTTRTAKEQERCPVCNLAFDKFEVIR
ncbi:rubrerythrin family protein [Occallatibacter savannae]|uniref:rubrerythrin family protein n=1 Tax=Occallatibacter savannae TaxID=1002691 RepID=UPI000D694A6A|nr:ferritin family protein [Occallatibacter savannae]